MWLMVVASNRVGRLSVKDGKLCLQSATQRERGIIPTPAPPKESVIHEIDESPTKLPKPTRLWTTSPNGAESDIQLDRRSLPESLLLRDFDCTTEEDFIMGERVANLASLELMFHLHHWNKTCNILWIMSEMLRLDVSLPPRFNINDLRILQSTSINNVIANIKRARERLVQCLRGFFEPGNDQMLYERLVDSKL